MSLTNKLLDEHINFWSNKLANTAYPYRKGWPHYLYRHERVENAAEILLSGKLLSRKEAKGKYNYDIAAPEIISTSKDAYEYVRLYFRPRNPTQYRVEGILKPEELYKNQANTHAPILIIFQFKAKAILNLNSVCFSNGNMQSTNKKIGTSADFFHTIPFHHVYHEGFIDKASKEGKEIIHARCAEALVPSSIFLEDNLEKVICRSPAERTTLLHLLGNRANNWQNKIHVFKEPGMFFSEKSYVQTVESSSTAITMNFHPRKDGKAIKISIEVIGPNKHINTKPINFIPDELLVLKTKTEFEPGVHLITIYLDDHIAYKANFLIDDLPF